MRLQKVILLMVLFLILATVPIVAYALTVVISNGVATVTCPTDLVCPGGTGPTTDAIGVTTTTVNLNGLTVGGFTIDTTPGLTQAKAIAEQSGSVERIIIVETTITAPSTCSTTSPCSITITATSDAGDFPNTKPPGGYPSGVIVSSFVFPAGASAAGDKVSVSGLGQGEFINATPGPGDSQVSLPKACTGDPGAQVEFDGTSVDCPLLSAVGSYYDDIIETIQLDCAGAEACSPSMQVSVDMTFANPGDQIDLPVGFAQARKPQTGQSSLDPLILPLNDTGLRIDIKPGSFPNSINLGSGGSVPVAILSSPIFDARTVDPSTVTLEGANVALKGKGTPMASFKDVNGDGLLDLVVHVATDALELSSTDKIAVLKGKTFPPPGSPAGTLGTPIQGMDTIRVVP